MRTFKQFLDEELIFEETFTKGDLPFAEVKNGSHVYSHKSKVGNKEVAVHFSHYGGNHRHYDASFTVNGSHHHADQPDARDNKHILHHIHKVVSSFVKEKKPQSLNMHGFDSDETREHKKKKAYALFANKVARDHNGHAKHDEYGSRVSFNH